MITRRMVSDKLLAYLNEEITLPQLIDWAENCFIEGGFAPEADVPLLREVLMYIAAGDTGVFPLTWQVCMDFLKQLGTPVRVVPVIWQ